MADPDRVEKPRPASPRREEGAKDSAKASKDDQAHRPTPVREMMASEVGAGADWEAPSRTFQHGEEEWVVILAGQTKTGLPSDPGAPLMHLRFARGADPKTPVKELLCVGSGLENLFDEELRAYLDRARPYQGDPTE